jgi:hypothetical protein
VINIPRAPIKIKRKTFAVPTAGSKPRIVHITYNVKETTRITHSILEEKPARLYYFRHSEDIYPQNREENLALVRAKLPHCDIIEKVVDYVDYFQIIGTLAEIFTIEKAIPNTTIVINAGTGSKMVAIANLDAFRLWPVGVKLIYPYSMDYNPGRSMETHTGAMKAAHPPEFRLKIPEITLIKALQILYSLNYFDENGRKKGFATMNETRTRLKEFNVATNERHADRILKALRESWHFIHFNPADNPRQIFFTPRGKQFALIFRNFDSGLDLGDIKIHENDPPMEDLGQIEGFGPEIEWKGKVGDYIQVPLSVAQKNQNERIVHMVYLMNEEVRIMNPILNDPPAKLIYFHHQTDKKTDKYMPLKKDHISRIRAALPQLPIEEYGIDYVDYYQAITTVTGLIRRELAIPKTKIVINTGTGSKMIGMMNLDLFRLFPEHVILKYPYTRDYNTERPGDAPFHQGELFEAMIPQFEFEVPSKEIIRALKILDDLNQMPGSGAYRNSVPQQLWMEKLESAGLITTNATDETVRRSALDNQLHRGILDPLEKEWEFVKSVKLKTKKGKDIKITDEGRKFIGVFRNLDLD